MIPGGTDTNPELPRRPQVWRVMEPHLLSGKYDGTAARLGRCLKMVNGIFYVMRAQAVHGTFCR